MEEFNDWLYWLIIIIAGISSIIGSINKKNKQEAEKRQSREIITEDREDVFEDSDETETKQPVIPERQSVFPERQPVFSERQSTVSGRRPGIAQDLHVRQKSYFDHKTPGRKPGYGSSFEKDTAENAALYTTDDNAAITLEDLPANTEEWRKAFIYNEIFKRKY
jgi:hypothetical protein